ncbi:hypothetical protein Q7P37_004859 [Cladosporium fusiforme]
MAKLAASRRQGENATPDPTAPAQTTRSTRAGSREPNEPQTPRRSARARNARSASVESDAAAIRNTTGAAAVTGMRLSSSSSPLTLTPNPNPNFHLHGHLTTVDEDAPEDDQEINAGVDEPQAEQEQEYALEDFSPSKGSAISGTTVKTTFSQEEVDELDNDVMLDSLKNLYTASEQLMSSLIPSGVPDLAAVREEIATPGTKAYKLYQKRLSAFALYKGDYTTTQTYIQPANVSRALFEARTVDEIPQDAAQPDTVLRAANLAYMLHMLLVEICKPGSSDDEKSEILEAADHAFPTVVVGSSFDQLALRLSIAITTRLAISRIASFVEDPNYSPQGIATHAFFWEDDDGTQSYRHYRALHLDTLDEQQQAAYMDQIAGLVNELKEPFGDDSQIDPLDAVDALHQKFTWRSLIDNDLLPYYTDRKHELDQVVMMAGGIDGLDEHIKTAVANKDNLKRYHALRANLGQAAGRPKRSAAPDEIQQLRELTQHNAVYGTAPQPMAAVAQMTAPSQPSDGGIASQHDGFLSIDQFDDAATAPAPVSRDIHDLSQFQNIKNAQAQRGSLPGKGKAKSFNDPQVGARRVPWDEDQPSQTPGRGPYPYPPQSNLGKRSRGSDEPESSFGKRARVEGDQEDQWDPTQDGGPQDEDDAFETKVSDNAAADERRRQAPAVIQHARPALSRPIHPRTSDAGPGMTQASPERRNTGSAVPNANEFPASGSQYSRAQEYQQATYIAKQERVLHPPNPVRARQVWTDEETEALMQYIENWDAEDSLHYVAMKRLDDSEEGMKALGKRTSEDLRFRARNVKVNLLLGRSDINDNWKKVQLGKKEIDKLHSRGVPYVQAGLRGSAVANPTDQNY